MEPRSPTSPAALSWTRTFPRAVASTGPATTGSPVASAVHRQSSADFDRARAAMEATEVNARWQAEMAEFFEELDGRARDVAMRPLTEVFPLA
ncbi:L-rhamnose mutarotase [Streptomyces venezuelae]|nr:L-rhamnose mutarotase [Streptomyces venezuelae]